MVSLRVSLNKGRIKEINQVASRGFENARSGLLRNGDESIVVPLSGIGFTGSLDGLRAILLEVGRLGVGLSGVGLSGIGHQASGVGNQKHTKRAREVKWAVVGGFSAMPGGGFYTSGSRQREQELL